MDARTHAAIAGAVLALAAASAHAQGAASAPRGHDPWVGHDIAQLGNHALATIRTELAQALRQNVALPELPVRVELNRGEAEATAVARAPQSQSDPL